MIPLETGSGRLAKMFLVELLTRLKGRIQNGCQLVSHLIKEHLIISPVLAIDLCLHRFEFEYDCRLTSLFVFASNTVDRCLSQ